MLEFDADTVLSIALTHDERKAFDMIFTRYYPRVKQFVLGFCGDEYEAENIAQDIFMKLWIQRDRIAAIETLDAYIYMMAKKDRKSTRLNSSHANISYAVFCLKKKKHTLITY